MYDKSAKPSARLVALVVFLLGFVMSAEASTLVVAVKNAATDNQITGAKVCVGSATGSWTYGVAVTGPKGQPWPRFEIPDNVRSVVVTVTKQGFQGVQQTVSLNSSAQNGLTQIWISLAEGSGGPTCAAALPSSIPQIPIVINNFQINGGQPWTTDRIVKLDVSYAGTASHYQVSESPDFSGASWKDMPTIGDNQLTYNFDAYAFNVPIPVSPARITVPITGAHPAQAVTKPSGEKYGTKTLYFRLKNGTFISGKRSDAIELRPKVREYFVRGDELKELLKYAKEQGFSFDFSANQEPDCAAGFEGVDFGIPGIKLTAHASCALGIPPPTVLISTRQSTSTFFGGRTLNRFWRMSEFIRFERKDLWDEAISSESSFSVTRRPSATDPSFTVEFKFTRNSQGIYPVYSYAVVARCQALECRSASIQLMSLTLEGPEDDNWVDPNKRWKNAFLSQ